MADSKAPSPSSSAERGRMSYIKYILTAEQSKQHNSTFPFVCTPYYNLYIDIVHVLMCIRIIIYLQFPVRLAAHFEYTWAGRTHIQEFIINNNRSICTAAREQATVMLVIRFPRSDISAIAGGRRLHALRSICIHSGVQIGARVRVMRALSAGQRQNTMQSWGVCSFT